MIAFEENFKQLRFLTLNPLKANLDSWKSSLDCVISKPLLFKSLKCVEGLARIYIQVLSQILLWLVRFWEWWNSRLSFPESTFTFNPWIRIFFKIPAVSLSLLYWPLTSCRVSEKTNEGPLRYLKKDQRTDRWTDKGHDRVLHGTMDPIG